MCRSCWVEAGSPAELPPHADEFKTLADELYWEHPTGGPLHVVLDDWNIEGTIQTWTDGGFDPPTMARAERIAALLNSWTREQRAAALAYWEGFTTDRTGQAP